ncbi:germination protein YpeB [Clostridium sp. JNZ J1-5]|nr:germination protein YpeB [Clostridium sp.]
MKIARKRFIYTAAVAIIVVFSSTFAILMTLERTDYRNYLQGEYSKSMYQLIDSVKNIKSELAKSAVLGSKEQSIVAFENVFRYSSIANDKIHSLPISQQYMEGTSNFLAKVGDYSYTLVKNSTQGKDLTDKDYNNIEELKSQADYLLIQLNEIQQDINQGKVKWGEIRKKASKALDKTADKLVSSKFSDLQKQVVQYPALIYDGPFSDNTVDIKPRVLSEKQITEQEASNLVKNLLGADKIQNITKKEGESTRIPSYSFNVELKGRGKGENVACEVSKNGGKVIYLLDNKNVSTTAKYDVNKAINMGAEYLSKLGYKDMKPTYNIKYDNVVTISYVYHQDNVAIYTDQIKLKIALDDGSVIGIESEKYLTSHVDKRDIPKPKISETQAKEKVGKNLQVSSPKLAIVPTETNKEALCYEFSGKYRDDNFIVYINAETGYEQKILQIINTPNGQLTI